MGAMAKEAGEEAEAEAKVEAEAVAGAIITKGKITQMPNDK